MTISAILGGKGHEVATVAASTSVRDAVGLLAARRIGAVPVVDEGAIVGIFSERDVIRLLATDGPAMLDRPVSEAMNAPAVTAELETPVLAALATMTQRRIRHLPVMQGGQIRGIVSIGDLVKYRIEKIEAEAEALRTYIQSS